MAALVLGKDGPSSGRATCRLHSTACRRGRTHAGRDREREQKRTHLLSTLAVLPLLVPEDGRAVLLGRDTLGLRQRLAECARADLAVLVEAARDRQRAAGGGRGG